MIWALTFLWALSLAAPASAVPMFMGLGDLPGGVDSSRADGVSADGSAVVGVSRTGGTVEAFIWTPNGLRRLQDVLVNDYGLDLGGWALTTALDISDDGRTIVGYGHHLIGPLEAWIAIIPEPSTALIFGFGLAALAVWRTRLITNQRSLEYLVEHVGCVSLKAA